MTSIVNPHATISLVVSDKNGDVIEQGKWIRTTNKLPRVVREIRPHPKGVHLGTLQRLLRDAEERRMTSFLQKLLISTPLCNAKRILGAAQIEESRTPKRIREPKSLNSSSRHSKQYLSGIHPQIAFPQSKTC